MRHYVLNMGFSLTPKQTALLTSVLRIDFLCVCEMKTRSPRLGDVLESLGLSDFSSIGEIVVNVSSGDYLTVAPKIAQIIADTTEKAVECFYWFPTGYRRLLVRPTPLTL